jgi:hypothetical protein
VKDFVPGIGDNFAVTQDSLDPKLLAGLLRKWRRNLEFSRERLA